MFHIMQPFFRSSVNLQRFKNLHRTKIISGRQGTCTAHLALHRRGKVQMVISEVRWDIIYDQLCFKAFGCFTLQPSLFVKMTDMTIKPADLRE